MRVPPTPAGEHAAVVGGGITGLAAALILSRRGARVSIVERDAEPSPPSAAEAFRTWERRGAPQVRHSHIFLGRLRNLLRDEYPDLLQALLEAGARPLHMTERPPQALLPLRPEPGDDDLVALGCRRTTFEWVLRHAALRTGRVDFIGGAQVHGLLAETGDPPVVRGLRYRGVAGAWRDLEADMVIDASGRRSTAPQWLAAIGAREPEETCEPSGIVYYTRFYRLRPGAAEPPPTEHPTAADFNWVKYAVFPADEEVFSITLAVPLTESRLKVLAREAAFETMVRCIPALAPWVDAAVSEPMESGRHAVRAMGGLVNRLRRFVDERGPLALRLFVLGDAAYCTNPLYGRGCAQGFLHAHFLRQALDEHPGDPLQAALALDRRGRREILPFYRASVVADRDAVRRAEGRTPRRLRHRLQQRFFEDGVGPAMRCDPVVFRAFLRMMNMMQTPEEAFGEPRVLLRSLRVLMRGRRYNRRYALPPPPDREATISRCEAAGDRQGDKN